MASIHSVQNFSLPSRAGSRRTVTPLGRPGAATLDRRHHLVLGLADVRRARPMSTSSSAPALTTAIGDVASAGGHEGGPRWGEARQGQEKGRERGPSPGLAVGPAVRPPSRPAVRPAASLASFAGSDGLPPPLARAISVRWGPRLRHISLSEVQAADDIVRALARQRRRRLALVLLVAVLFAGLLSCTAAVTLVAASEAVRATTGAATSGGSDKTTEAAALSWQTHGIAWLAASLAVCAPAGALLAVLARRQRQQAAKDDRESGRQEDSQRREWREMETGVEMEMGVWTGEDRPSGQLDQAKVDGSTAPKLVCEEDRNWARFIEDPLQLRRYVEALEGRLALAQETPGKEEIPGKEGDKTEAKSTATNSTDRNLLGRAITSSSINSSSSNAVVGGLAIGGPDASSNSLLLPLSPPSPPSPPPRLPC